MSYKLYLDDARPCPPGWYPVYSFNEFVGVVSTSGVPDEVSFDHDLADAHYPWNDPSYATGVLDYDSYAEKTGYDCAKYLCEYCNEEGLDFPKYSVHSMNVIGRENIIAYIEGYKRNASVA